MIDKIMFSRTHRGVVGGNFAQDNARFVHLILIARAISEQNVF